jgi:hypothetical protein
MAPPASEAPAVDIEVKRLMHLYLAGEYDRLSALFLKVFEHFDRTSYLSLTDSNRASLLRFLKIFLTLFTQPDYLIPDGFILPFIKINYLLSNLLAATPFKNTDGFLALLGYQPQNFIKILTLYSARNTLRFDRKMLFDTNAQLASFWYNEFCTVYKTGLASEEVANHLAEHLAYRDERATLSLDLQEGYFASTYLGGSVDKEVKPFLNQIVRRSLTRLTCDNTPNPNKIAVFSDLWFPLHSVYRNYAAFVKELKKKFHLTFFHSLARKESLDTSMFDEVHQLPFTNNVLNVDRLLTNDFQAIYYPDIGMTLPSIMLANHRIAPVQFCSPGHSVSTYGADIDYFISGRDVEIPDEPEDNYSERLVLLPGMGVIHNKPLYDPTGVKKTTSAILVNCPWMGQKINWRFLATFRKLLDRLDRQVRFRLFPGTVSKDNSYIPFVAEVREALGQNAPVDIMPYTPYQRYMNIMEEGDLTLDSFHFSGCNTVAESMFIRKPTLVWEGDKWYNRIGPSMLRMAGLPELVAQSEDEYLEKAERLIKDDDYREDLAARLRETDLNATVFSTSEAPVFLRAVEYLIENHETLKAEGERKAIVIE